MRFSNKQSDESIKKVLAEIKKRDTRKNNLIAAHPEEIKHFIRLSYKDVINKESVIKMLKLNSIEIEV